MRVDTYVYTMPQTCANPRSSGGRESALAGGDPRIEVAANNQHERAGAGFHTLVFRPLALADEPGEIDPLQPCNLGGGRAGQEVVGRCGGRLLACHTGTVRQRSRLRLPPPLAGSRLQPPASR